METELPRKRRKKAKLHIKYEDEDEEEEEYRRRLCMVTAYRIYIRTGATASDSLLTVHSISFIRRLTSFTYRHASEQQPTTI